MNRYERTQIGWVVICVVCIAIILVAVKLPSESSTAQKNSLLVLGVLTLTLALFYKLTVKIVNSALRISLGVGLIRRTIELGEIEATGPVRIRWWYGWGIHLTPYGWLYNVTGWDAVAIKLRNGRKLAIGTADPQGLLEAIRRFTSAR